jgi:hypothetical protein
MHTKLLEDLTVDDIKSAPVWQFTNVDGPRGETVVRPIKKVPVKSLNGRMVGTSVLLANGSRVWALLGNIVSDNPRFTRHFLTLSVERNGKWFGMARYHDYDAKTRGPKALAKFLGFALSEVFPVSYDISHICKGERDSLVGTIEKDPGERLTRRQIIGLVLED